MTPGGGREGQLYDDDGRPAGAYEAGKYEIVRFSSRLDAGQAGDRPGAGNRQGRLYGDGARVRAEGPQRRAQTTRRAGGRQDAALPLGRQAALARSKVADPARGAAAGGDHARSGIGSAHCTMKTQLLQDIDENGSHARPLFRRAPPVAQVWRRARHRPAPSRAPPATPPPAPSSSPSPSRPAPSPTETRPLGATAPHTGSITDIPGWLSERLREDAERDERAEWRGQWQRRAVTWSMGISLLAIVAAGGLWLYEDSRVDGALGVVAHTTPEPQPQPAPLPVKLPVDSRPVDNPSVLSAMPDPAPRTPSPEPASIAVAEPLPSEPPIVPVRASAEPPVPAAAAPASPAQPKPRERRRTGQAPLTSASTADKTSGLSGRQRREETLMQCRAHGYDQRQCERKNCSMTRYGFACKG
jgi:hypothetical protein